MRAISVIIFAVLMFIFILPKQLKERKKVTTVMLPRKK